MIEASYFLLYHDYPVTKMAKVFAYSSREAVAEFGSVED